jgi:hypothetical protein
VLDDGPTEPFDGNGVPKSTLEYSLPEAEEVDDDPAVAPSVAEAAPGRRAAGEAPAATPSHASVFERTRYRFMSGIPAGETARVRDDSGEILLGYRSFASVVGVIAALVSGVVLIAGLAAVGFLVAEGRVAPAILALMLSAGFAVVIAMLVPSINVTIFEGTTPVITIAQESNLAFPSVTHAVIGREGRPIARLRKNVMARFGRNRWTILSGDADRVLGYAAEESLSRAMIRKLGGKFSPDFESNVRIHYLDKDAGWIVRRPDTDGVVDLLDLTEDGARLLDRRVAIAIATLVLGAEP